MTLAFIDAANVMGDQNFQAPVARVSGAGTQGLAEASMLERHDRLQRMRQGTLGSIHSWELVTAVDGPGTRLTIFFSGCPLQCLYCHNPDTLKMRDGTPVELNEIIARIRRYRKIFRATGGGITLSGGEVLMQPAFAEKILEAAKEMGIHTTIDTSGYLGAAASDEFLHKVDLVLLDVKSGIPDTYEKVTGRQLQPTIDFGDRLSFLGIDMWVRFVLVPGLTDAPENIAAVADVISRWETVRRVEVLPFHQMGRDKWASLGLPYALDDTLPPTPDQTEAVREVFRERGWEVR